MTTWKPDTCECVADWEAARLIEKCVSHNSFNQTVAHNRSFNLRDGRNPTDQQQAQQGLDKAAEKRKPAFARR